MARTRPQAPACTAVPWVGVESVCNTRFQKQVVSFLVSGLSGSRTNSCSCSAVNIRATKLPRVTTNGPQLQGGPGVSPQIKAFGHCPLTHWRLTAGSRELPAARRGRRPRAEGERGPGTGAEGGERGRKGAGNAGRRAKRGRGTGNGGESEKGGGGRKRRGTGNSGGEGGSRGEEGGRRGRRERRDRVRGAEENRGQLRGRGGLVARTAPHLQARAPGTSPRLPSPRGRPALSAHEAPLSELGASAASPWKSPVSATTVVNCLSCSSTLSILCRFTGDPDMASCGGSGRPTMPCGPSPRARPIRARRRRAGLRACARARPRPRDGAPAPGAVPDLCG